MRLSQYLKDNILKEEIRLNFEAKENAAQTKLSEAIEAQLKIEIAESGIKVPKALIDGGYIKMCGDVEYRIDDVLFRVQLSNTYPLKVYAYKHRIMHVTKAILYAHENKVYVQKDKSDFCLALRKVLAAFSTDAQLIKAIPELSYHFKKDGNSMSQALVPIEQINAIRSQLAPRKHKE